MWNIWLERSFILKLCPGIIIFIFNQNISLLYLCVFAPNSVRTKSKYKWNDVRNLLPSVHLHPYYDVEAFFRFSFNYKTFSRFLFKPNPTLRLWVIIKLFGSTRLYYPINICSIFAVSITLGTFTFIFESRQAIYIYF